MARKHYLLVSDFDQTLSFNDSGHVLSEMLESPTSPSSVAGCRDSTSCSRAPS